MVLNIYRWVHLLKPSKHPNTLYYKCKFWPKYEIADGCGWMDVGCGYMMYHILVDRRLTSTSILTQKKITVKNDQNKCNKKKKRESSKRLTLL